MSICISRGDRWSLTSLKVNLNRGLLVCILHVVVNGASITIYIISMVSRARPLIYEGLASETNVMSLGLRRLLFDQPPKLFSYALTLQSEP